MMAYVEDNAFDGRENQERPWPGSPFCRGRGEKKYYILSHMPGDFETDFLNIEVDLLVYILNVM